MSKSLSILMPVYNVSEFLDCAVNSVINQTSPDWRLIMVDDGSTDDSGEKCDKYAKQDKRIKVIHKANEGLVSARRAAIDASDSDFCMFLDSDDFISCDAVEKIHLALDKHNPEMLIYSGYFYNPDGSTKELSVISNNEEVIDNKDMMRLLYTYNDFNSLWTKVIATHLLKEDPYNYSNCKLSMGEDKLLSLYPCSSAEKIVVLNERFYYYRQNSASLTKVLDSKKLNDLMMKEVFEVAYSYMEARKEKTYDNLQKMSLLFWSSVLRIFQMLLESKSNEEEINSVLLFDYKSCVPSFILPYKSCRQLSLKSKIKIDILYKHRRALFRLIQKNKSRKIK